MRRVLGVLIAVTVLLAGCGGGGDDGGDAASPTATVGSEATTTAGASGTSAGSESPGGEVPAFSQDFDRVCTTQVGFAGVATYDRSAPGPHPAIVFTEDGTEDGRFIESSATLPDGWLLVQDDNFEDNSDLATVELVACVDRTASTPNGTVCEFDDDGETITLNLVDATYDVVVHEAATGAEVGRTTVEAATTDCPFFVFVDQGQTDYVNRPTDDDLTTALKPFVTP